MTVSNCLSKVTSLFIVIALFLLFFIGYFFSLVIIKPRDVTKVVEYIDDHFRKGNSNISIASERVIVAWNQKEFTFDIRFLNSTIKIGGDEINLPTFVVDISRRNLLIGKFQIDGLKIPELNYVLNDKVIASYKKETKELKAKDLTEIFDKNIAKLSVLRRAEIGELNLQSFDGTEILQVKNLEYSLKNRITKYLLFFNFELINEEEVLSVAAQCDFSFNIRLKECAVDIADIPNSLLHKTEMLPLGYKAKTDLGLELLRNAEGYEVLADLSLRDLEFHLAGQEYSYEQLNVNGKVSILPNNLRFDDVSILLGDRNLEISADYDLEDKNLIFAATGENINTQEIFLLWPEFAARKTRRWLKKNIISARVKDFFINFDLNLGVKRKMNKFLGEFNVIDADLEFARTIKPLRNIVAKVRVEDKDVAIKVVKAQINDAIIRNWDANIPAAKPGNLKLFINGDLNLPAQDLTEFLLDRTMNPQNLRNLNGYFIAAKLVGPIELEISLKKAFTLRDLKIDFQGELDGPIKGYLGKKSSSAVKLLKKYNDFNFYVNSDFKEAEVMLPMVAHRKVIGEDMSGSFIFRNSKSGLKIYNINLGNKGDSIQGEVAFNKQGLSRAYFKGARFGPNLLDVNLNQKDGYLRGDIIGSKAVLSERLLSNKSSSSNNMKNFNANFHIERLSFEGQKKSFNSKGQILCNEVCDLLYVEGYFNTDNHFTYKAIETSRKKTLTLETDNAGDFLTRFKISNRIKEGQLHLKATKDKGAILEGKVTLNNFKMEHDTFSKELAQLKSFEGKDINIIPFEKGEINFNIDANNDFNISDTIFFGSMLGITSEGFVNLDSKALKIKGYIIPAYKINNLFGVKDIPVVGKILTGEKNQGLLSAKFSVRGTTTEPEFKINPLSAIVPNALRKVGSFFTPRFWGEQKDKMFGKKDEN